MEQIDRRVLGYLDLESARGTLEAAGASAGALAAALVAFARGHGRLLCATCYGALDPDEARAVKRGGCDVRLTSDDGEGSAPESIAITFDAAVALVEGPGADAVVIVTDDAQLSEVARRLRRAGRFVVMVVPAALADSEPARSGDRVVTLEALLAGEAPAESLPEPASPKVVREAVPVPQMPRDQPPVPRARPPSGQTIDFDRYDWTRLVLLLRDLEAKMPFVGMRWLKNKVIGPHNVGAATVADKQLLLNRAVDAGLLETYRVDNRVEAGDPVTACRLLREAEQVRTILEAHPAPPLVTDPSTSVLKS